MFTGLTAAHANTVFTPEMRTTNGSIHVGMTSNGVAGWSADGNNWVTVNSGLTKNGVRSLMYSKKDNLFIATGFFSYAVSADGKTWSTGFLPVGEKFNPANIIEDSEFFGATSMSVNDIQGFISSKINGCAAGYTCLDTFKETTWSRDATLLCDRYVSDGVETAAQIIWKVSQACKVKAEVLLVTLQKENSLVTSTAPSSNRYKTAMGYACPDTAACDSEYFGFYNQVYNAAKQFKRYANPPGTSLYFTWYPVGKVSNVRWSPDASCGTSPVVIANQATSGLYYYTPYQPNAAALKNINGLGDDCSAYGNRNFWRNYNSWFNTDVNYVTFIAGNSNGYVSVDDEGTVAVSTNGKSWSLKDPMKIKGGIVSFEYDEYNSKYHATTSNGFHYYSTDGASWKEETVELPDGTLTAIKGLPYQEVQDKLLESIPATVTVNTEATPSPAETKASAEKINPIPPVEESPAVQSSSPSKDTLNVSVYDMYKTYYVIVEGDTLWGIGQKYNTSVYNIMLLNPDIETPSKIYVGQKILF